MVQSVTVTSPSPVILPLKSGWVVYGPENNYNFPYTSFFTLSPLSPGGTHMVQKKPMFLSTPGLQGLKTGWAVYGP